jgi:transcriptional regulator with XRE-family HTH domain
MSMDSVAAYLRTLRERQKISRAQIVGHTGASEQSIWRIETNDQEPKAELLVAFVDAVNGDIRHVYELLREKSSTAEDGMRLAEQRLKYLVARGNELPKGEESDVVNTSSLVKKATKLVDRLRGNEVLLAEWVGYGNRIAEEQAEYKIVPK